MSLEDELKDIIEQMKVRGVEFEAGLSDEEVNTIEALCNFRFPPDLKMFLQLAVPVARKNARQENQFPNWHNDPVEIMRENTRIWQNEFYYDIENRHFWITEWGEKPENLAEQLAVVKAYLQDVPIMIPIFLYAMIPAEPSEAGNPIFSVVQANDTIHMGYNLQNYLRNNFTKNKWDWGEDADYRHIPFWSKLAAGRFP